MNKKLTIATRKSKMALYQARQVGEALQAIHNGLEIEYLELVTKGDKIDDMPLYKVGGKGLFLKELEKALLNKEADIAVHSMKDVPMELPKGLELPVICQRHQPSDCFVSETFDSIESLPKGAIIGTSSLRRQCLIKKIRPDLVCESLRGNVQTRLRKLQEQNFDGIILGTAGLHYLNLDHHIKQELDTAQFIPACGQGTFGIECRANDETTNTLIAPLNHLESSTTIKAERAVVRRLNGSCHTPIGVYATLQDDQLHIRTIVGMPDASIILQDEISGPAKQGESLGIQLAEKLLNQGAGEILESTSLS